jgi:hypothetical protein
MPVLPLKEQKALNAYIQSEMEKLYTPQKEMPRR